MTAQPDVNVNRFECSDCGWISYPPPHVESLFHPCVAKRSRRQLRRRDPALVAAALDREAERAQWAVDTFGPLRDSLEDAVDDVDLLRRIEEDE